MSQPQNPPKGQSANGNFWFYSAPKDLEPKGAQRNFFLAGGDLIALPEQQLHPAAAPVSPGAAALSSGPVAPVPGAGAAQPSAGGSSAFRPASGFAAPGDLSSAGQAVSGGVSGAPVPGFTQAGAFTGAPQPGPIPGAYTGPLQGAYTGPAAPPFFGPALQVRIQQKTVQHGKKTLLRDIAFDVQHGDFVLILGGSGAGKTTLIRAILGESHADGQIFLNGQDLYTNFAEMKSQIGLVPQFLTLRLNDTVRNTVTDAAYIRLGRAFSKEEILMRVDSVLNKVGIMELQDSLIGQLSGGQKKKVSVAVQLVGFQRVFICDEPDSGLDAASRVQLMQLLKEISMTGKIVMVITHYPDDAVEMFSRVVVLAKSSVDKSGHLAYAGSVDGALKNFGVNRLQDIMKLINPPFEGGKGLADRYITQWNGVRRV